MDTRLNEKYAKGTWAYKSEELSLANDILLRVDDLIVYSGITGLKYKA